MFEGLSLSGQVLYILARVFGARVTGGTRTVEENKRVGGRANSAHLTGDAIDVGMDAPPAAIAVLKAFGKGGYDAAGTAPHYHFEATPLTAPLLVGVAVLIAGGLK